MADLRKETEEIIVNAVIDTLVDLITDSGLIEKIVEKVWAGMVNHSSNNKPELAVVEEKKEPQHKAEVSMDIAKMTIRGAIPIDQFNEIQKSYFYLIDFGQDTAEMFPACEWGCDKKEFATNELLTLSDYIEEKYDCEATRTYTGEVGKKLNLVSRYDNAMLFFVGSKRIGIIAKFKNSKNYRTTNFDEFRKMMGGSTNDRHRHDNEPGDSVASESGKPTRQRKKRDTAVPEKEQAPVRTVVETKKRRRSRNPGK